MHKSTIHDEQIISITSNMMYLCNGCIVKAATPPARWDYDDLVPARLKSIRFLDIEITTIRQQLAQLISQ